MVFVHPPAALWLQTAKSLLCMGKNGQNLRKTFRSLFHLFVLFLLQLLRVIALGCLLLDSKSLGQVLASLTDYEMMISV